MPGDPWSVDLHSHTLYSDGSQSPAELVRLAKANGVRALAITDHDHTGAIDEALVVGGELGLEIIPGIELSVAYAEFEDIHILAYYFAWHAPYLQEQLDAFRVARDTRGEQILARINAQLVAEGRDPIPYEVVKARVKGAFGRPHIANLLVERGYVPDMNAAFREYLVPCNVPKLYMPAEEALALIRQAHGVSAVAHPRFITPDRLRLQKIIKELKTLGLDGIETYHSDHNAEERAFFTGLAKQLGMVMTGGSDFHGFKTPSGHTDGGGKLGSLQLPYGVVIQLRREYLRRHPVALLLLHWPAAAAAAMRRAFQGHYQLPYMQISQRDALGAAHACLSTGTQSLVFDLPPDATVQLDTLLALGQQGQVHLVVVPWETASVVGHDGVDQSRAVSTQRLRRTPVERLCHEVMHEVLLVRSH